MKLKIYILNIILFLSSFGAAAQEWSVNWNAETDFLGGTGEYLPFWSRTGREGIVPYSSSALVIGGADVGYKAENGLYFEAGTNLVGSLVSRNPLRDTHVTGIVDRLYVSGGWRMLHLDVGLKPRIKELGNLSITGGSIVHTGNARNLPGINAWSDWIYFEKGHWVGIKGNFAHYQMFDNRYVSNAWIHNKSLAVKIALGRKVDFEACLDHWAQWGGESPTLGARPVSWKDYYRIIFGKGGGEDATISDQKNALGNHLGREYVRLNWRHSAFTATLQYDMPFEDGARIIKWEPMPDGVYTLKFAFNDREAFVTDVVYEFISTTWQSGPIHDRPATEEEMTKDYGKYVYWQDPEHFYYGRICEGGRDGYFGHSEYRSGWTYHGRTIGLPLLLPSAPNAEGMTMGMVCSRVRAHHLGLAGNMTEDLPYVFKATYSSNWGTYSTSEGSFFAGRPWQLSLALELEFGRAITNLPMTLAVGAYGDIGKLYQNSFGLTLRIRYDDSRRF